MTSIQYTIFKRVQVHSIIKKHDLCASALLAHGACARSGHLQLDARITSAFTSGNWHPPSLRSLLALLRLTDLHCRSFCDKQFSLKAPKTSTRATWGQGCERLFLVAFPGANGVEECLKQLNRFLIRTRIPHEQGQSQFISAILPARSLCCFPSRRGTAPQNGLKDMA